MEWITRVQKLLLVLLICSQIDFVVGSFLDSDPYERAQGFTGYNWNTTMANMGSGYKGEGFFSVFAVFFPAVTGITAGANMSGNLKDPATAIPGGTFMAIFFTYITYVGYGILVGAPRVLQALAADKLYPKIEFFAKGYGPGDDPVRGYILVFCIALGCILLGDLNVVSGLLSNFFVASYALINFSSFHASITKSPGWRPAFKYFNPWVSLFGCFLCLGCMFLMEWVTAILTFVIICILYLYLHYNAPEVNWGSSTQAQAFVTALKSVQALTNIQEHVKNFRPKLLVLSGNPTHRVPLIDFANLLTKKLSILICSEVLTDEIPKNTPKHREEVQMWFKHKKIQGFYDVLQNRSFAEGADACISLSGLGKLAPNMLLMGFKSNWAKDWSGAKEYLRVWNHAYSLKMSVILLRVRGGLDFSAHIVDEELVEPENLFPEDTILRRPEGLDRKISVEQGGKKKISVDRAQVSKLGLAVNSLVFGGFQPVDVLADIRQL